MSSPTGQAVSWPVVVGTKVGGRYEITGPIGSGGMGSVYAGHDTALDRPVAIKLLTRARSGDARATQRLLREARAMARVVHAASVQIFDSGTDGDYGAYLVMERLEGEDLSRFLQARGPLAQPLALALIEQICDAVSAAHLAGIVHRDLKPSNVFVLRHGPGAVPRIKLLDFGAAKISGDDDEMLTHPGDVLGTMVYMAPERWRLGARPTGDAPLETTPDVRTDVYALGVILYELLSGCAPFRAESQAALRLAVLNDSPDPLADRRPDIPQWLVAAIERAMSKSPATRPRDVAAFARTLGLTVTPGLAPAHGRALTGESFQGTARYSVIRTLAQTPNAEVYEARDNETDSAVALKRLRIPSGEAGFRLKGEFRIASEIHHPNLVRLYSLWEEQDDLFLTMELVRGIPFLDDVAGSPARLRAGLLQLVLGLGALHARGLAHCDVKPQNILVESTSRVVLLDCGLTARWGKGAGVRGTTPYMAPECMQGQVGPESDLYAVGVILHQALTGDLPRFDADRTTADGTRSAERRLGRTLPDGGVAPEANDLAALCARLLAIDPMDRPSSADVLAALSVGAAEAASSGAPVAPSAADTFVGRRDALEALEQAVAEVEAGAPRIVLVEGASGIGKSALLHHFRRKLDQDGRTLLLSGRARAGDSIPLPALDEAIDQLGSHLLHLPPSVSDVLLPRSSGHLARLFPTLARVPSIAKAARTTKTEGSPAHLRRQAFSALRDLFKRLGERQLVVLLVDDLQWIDPDSITLLAELIGGNDPPALLVVGAIRSDGQGGTTATERDVRNLEIALRQDARRVKLDPLSPRESCALARARWRGHRPLDTQAATRLARQSGGVPFFVELLATASVTVPEGKGDTEDGVLQDVLVRYQNTLPAEARQALQLICVSSRPLLVELVLNAVGSERTRALDPLFASSFIRSTQVNGVWAVEPYHDTITQSVRGAIPPAERQAHHQRLVEELRLSPTADPETLAEHLAASGDNAAAAKLAQSAAQVASRLLAFDRAAALFGMALSYGRPDSKERLMLVRQQAAALHDAGRRSESGEVLLRAAETFEGTALADDLRREAGTHLLLSGDITRGLAALAPALAAAGLHAPSDFAETVQATTNSLGALMSRGLTPTLAPVETGEAGTCLLARIDLCLLLAQGLAHIDLRVLPFACQALHLALDAGEPERMQRACALFVINTVEYVPNALVHPALELCRRLTEKMPAPYARALLDAALAENAHFESDFLAAEAAFERAERTLLQSCPGATRELATVRDIAVFIQYAQKGDFRTQLDRTQSWQAQAELSRDVFHASMLRVAHAIVWIAHDQPQRARADLERALSDWPGAAGVLEVAAALYHDIIDRYEEKDLLSEAGDPGPAVPMRSALLRSPAAQTPFLSGYLGLQGTWVGLRALAAGRAPQHAAHGIRETIAGLRALALPIWSAVSDALEANLDFLMGDRERAVTGLDQAEQKFRRLQMACLAACARKRRGQFTCGEFGERLEAEANHELLRLGVAKPERWTRAYWSMFDARVATAGTDDGGSGADAHFPAG